MKTGLAFMYTGDRFRDNPSAESTTASASPTPAPNVYLKLKDGLALAVEICKQIHDRLLDVLQRDLINFNRSFCTR